MKHLYLSAILCFGVGIANSQTFLNGDFEINSASNCEYNLANADYSSKMNNSWAFGSGEEVDIQTFVCGYDTPPSNNWFVSLSKDTDGNCDAISLELSHKLVAGNQYQISYMSSALTGDTRLQFGLSNNNQNFGETIFSSMPILGMWLEATQTFIAPNNGNYITVRTDCTNSAAGWDLLDNLQITATLGIGHDDLEKSIAVYPNPSSGTFTISTTTNIQDIKVYNTVGQLILSKQTDGLSAIDFNLNVNGVYFLNMTVGGQSVSKKLVVR
jgi:hypothetical protein